MGTDGGCVHSLGLQPYRLGVVEISTTIFDVFRLQPDGSELHVGEAASYNMALLHIELLGSKVPAKYIIQDRENGQRHVLNFGGL